jgi:hypothetical protein
MKSSMSAFPSRLFEVSPGVMTWVRNRGFVSAVEVDIAALNSDLKDAR